MKRVLLLMIVALAVGILAPTLHAAMVLKLDDGTTSVTIPDGSTDDQNSLTGVITFIDSIGNWVVNVTTGQSKPILGGPDVAELDLNSVDTTSSGPATLDIWLTDTDFTVPASEGKLLSGIAVTTVGTVTFEQIYDPDNSEFAADDTGNDTVVILGPFSSTSGAPEAFSGMDSKVIETFANPFSLTEHVVITHSGKGSTSFDAYSIVPVPGAVLLGILGLGVAGIKLRKYA